jgi:hypothetical protein
MHQSDTRINTIAHSVRTLAPGAYEYYATSRWWTTPDINTDGSITKHDMLISKCAQMVGVWKQSAEVKIKVILQPYTARGRMEK